jgi:hypothetical protein
MSTCFRLAHAKKLYSGGHFIVQCSYGMDIVVREAFLSHMSSQDIVLKKYYLTLINYFQKCEYIGFRLVIVFWNIGIVYVATLVTFMLPHLIV